MWSRAGKKAWFAMEETRERERGNSKGKAKNEVNRRWAFIAG